MKALKEALASLTPKQEAMKDKVVKTLDYLGFVITVYEVNSERFGKLYWAENNIGEPYMNRTLVKDMADAITAEKKDIEIYVRENQ